jgi:hypothetical protein
VNVGFGERLEAIEVAEGSEEGAKHVIAIAASMRYIE